MKKFFQAFAWSVGVLVIAVAALAALSWTHRTIWPDFQPTNDPAPQVVVKVEPDFAWRTGDQVPVTIFIKQKPNVSVDLTSLAVEGDFELAANPTVYTREFKDGTKYIRIDVLLQSFAVQPKVTMNATMSYMVKGVPDPKLISVPAVELYTSRTYDGRPQRQNGPMTVVNGWAYWLAGIALLVGLFGSIGCIVYLRRLKKLEREAELAPLVGRALARHDFEVVWQSIMDGKDGEDEYKEIARIIRRLYRIETKVTWEIPLELGDHHPHLKQILGINKLCDRTLYKGAPLTDSEKGEIRRLFDEITLPQKARALQPAPAPVAEETK